MEKKILVVDSTWPINTRTRKIADSLSPLASVEVCAWDRGSSDVPSGSADHVLRQRLGYGNKWKKLANLWRFFLHVDSVLEKVRPDVVVASHWECMFISAALKRKHGFRLVYDCLDVPTAANPAVRKMLWVLERHFFRRVDAVLFASRFFESLYPVTAAKRIVLENLPSAALVDVPVPLSRSGRYVVSWIGVVRYFETLTRLVDACAQLPDVELHVFGDGPDLPRLVAYCQGKDVIFHGRYAPENLSSLYAFSDLVWAAYPSSDFNVRYAISNKYHECLKYRVPGLFSGSTLLGQMVESEGVGVAVDEGDSGAIRHAITRGLKLVPPAVDVMSWEQAFRTAVPHILGE